MSIFGDIELIVRLKKVFNLFKEVSMGKNWKTTLFGFLAVLPQAWQVIQPSLSMPQPLANVITAIMGAVAFYFAKDRNVTGGTVKQ
jgi:hypothetical protein